MSRPPASSEPPGRVMLRALRMRRKIAGLEAVGGQALLRIVEINRLRQDAFAFDARGLGDAEQGAADEVV